jgi:hypothetical protein
MRRPVMFLLAGLVGGFAVASWWPFKATSTHVENVADPVAHDDMSGRLELVERLLAAEQQERRRLEQQLEALTSDVEGLHASTETGRGEPPMTSAANEASAGAVADGRELNRGRRRADAALSERLAEAGFPPDRAQWIETRVEQLRVEAMQARYDAQREGRTPEGLAALRSLDATLREELGDTDYERYLAATGRPTQVRVTNVLASSAAEQSGMLAGDEIYTYAGERVFDVRELNRLLLEGESGEPVVVDVMRDGRPIQLVIPRGPLGITSGGFRGRGPGAAR